MNKSPPRSGFHLQMMHNYFISRWVPGPFIYSGWHFFPVHWARSEKVEITLEIGREDTGAAKRVQKNYTEMLKDRCCRLSVMNILLRLSPLELFNVILLYKKKRRNARNKKQKQMKNTSFSRSKVLRSQEFGKLAFGKASAISVETGWSPSPCPLPCVISLKAVPSLHCNNAASRQPLEWPFFN